MQITTGATKSSTAAVICRRDPRPVTGASAYELSISKSGIRILYDDPADPTQDGSCAAVATLRQLFREYGRRLPCLEIRDSADFPRRGVMLDVSRGRVPRLETLLGLVAHLADLKINEFQLYTEHTFAYSKYEAVWRDWGAITGDDILKLSARCAELGIDLVPNQNSFGHLRPWLEHPPLRSMAETQGPWTLPWGDVVRWPFSLAPRHPKTIKFLRGLYDELLPYFQSRFFNAGCDETWDLGEGQSADPCRKLGKGTVYLNFLREIHKEVSRRGKSMMFWGDIILQHPDLLARLPKKKLIALNWGYEADHPFEREAALFGRAGIPFYVCPGTSSWISFIGRNDNAAANLESAARVGAQHGARGFLITDWGDGGHPQPLAVSYIPFAIGAGLSWCRKTFQTHCVVPMLNRDVFADPSGRTGRAAANLGLAHRRLHYRAFNCTPLGAALAAPPPAAGEIWCRDGLKFYARVSRKNLNAALSEIEEQLSAIRKGTPTGAGAKVLAQELELAARMAAESCRYMLWQQSIGASRISQAGSLARRAVPALEGINEDFARYWPLRNKATPKKCTAFLQWRIHDYKNRTLYYSPEKAGSKGLQ